MDGVQNDTIAAIATAPGKSGVCIVRVSGDTAGLIAREVLGFEPTPRLAHFSAFRDANGDTVDKGIGLYFEGPASFTGEDVLELQGHGGPAIQRLLLDRVLALGARLANPGEFSERAFLNNKIDLAQAEAIADLIDANSAQAAKSAMRTLNGEFSSRVNALVDELTKARVNIEAAIDFSDEDIDIIADTRVRECLLEIGERVRHALEQASQGALLKEGMRVVIAGKPNAGKSSLLNALSGEDSAIVTPIAGTTRDLLSESIQIDGMPVHITDTAGLRVSDDVVEQEGVRRAADAMRGADRILLVVDATTLAESSPPALTPELLPELLIEEQALLQKTLVVLNKADLVASLAVGPRSVRLAQSAPLTTEGGADEEHRELEAVALSAKERRGVDALTDALKLAIGFNSSLEGAFVARERHLIALRAAQSLVTSARQGLDDGQPLELIAEDLRLAQGELGLITGQVSSDDLLGEIFSNFCVGK